MEENKRTLKYEVIDTTLYGPVIIVSELYDGKCFCQYTFDNKGNNVELDRS